VKKKKVDVSATPFVHESGLLFPGSSLFCFLQRLYADCFLACSAFYSALPRIMREALPDPRFPEDEFPRDHPPALSSRARRTLHTFMEVCRCPIPTPWEPVDSVSFL